MSNLQNLITATDVQRNYKMIANRAKILEDEGLVIMANNRPEYAFMRFDLYEDLMTRRPQVKIKSKVKEKTGVDAVFGMWTKKKLMSSIKLSKKSLKELTQKIGNDYFRYKCLQPTSKRG